MHHVLRQHENAIDIALQDDVTRDEFKEVIHQLESLCTMHPKIRVLLDASAVRSYEFSLLLEEFDFYKKYKKHLERMAIVSDGRFQTFALNMLGKFADSDIEAFPPDQLREARLWLKQ